MGIFFVDEIRFVEMCSQVVFMINFKVQYVQFVQRQFMNYCGIFIDIISEYNSVQMIIYQCSVGIDVFCQVVVVNVYCVFCVFFCCVVVFNIAVVVGYFGQIQQVRFFGQQFVDCVNVYVQGVVQVEDDCWIDIIRMGIYDQIFQWGQVYRGVNVFIVVDSRNGIIVVQVVGDDVQFFYWFVQYFCCFLGYIEVVGVVCVVMMDVVFFVQVVRQGVEVRFFWYSLVECGVKYSNVFVFQLWERFQSFFDIDQVSWVVQWCKRSCIFDILNNRFIDYYGVGIFFVVVYDMVIDSSQLCRQFWFLCQNSINDKVECFVVSGVCI